MRPSAFRPVSIPAAAAVFMLWVSGALFNVAHAAGSCVPAGEWVVPGGKRVAATEVLADAGFDWVLLDSDGPVTLTLACGSVDMRRGSGHAPSLASQQAMAPQATAPMPLHSAPMPLHSAPMPFQTAPMPLYSAPMPLHTKPAPLLTQPMSLDPPLVGTPRPGPRRT